MTLTVRSAIVTGASTKGSALTHAEMDANWAHVIESSNQNFTPSGSGAIAEIVSDALKRLVHTAQYSTAGNFNTARDALSGTIGLHNLDLATPDATSGIVYRAGTRFMHSFGGDSMTFLGANAGNLTHTGSTLTGIGKETLNSVTTGVNLTAIGWQAMKALTTGEDCVAVGTLAMVAATAPRWSVSIGHAAGENITTPDYLTAVGYQAAENGTSGVRNTALGAKSLRAFTTGTDNIGIGFEAGTLLTEGIGNIAIGSFALDAATTTSNNVAVGHIAGSASTGAGNVFIGRSAGQDYTTPNNNTFVGLNAGNPTISGSPARTGTNNVAIGPNSGPTGAATNNSICIGDGATTAFSSNIAIGRNVVNSTTAGSTAKIGTALTDFNLSGRLHYSQIISEIDDDAGVAYTNAQFRGGMIIRTGAPGAGFNDTTPAASALVALIPGCEVNSGFEIDIHNTTGQTLTLVGGTNVTMSAATTTTVATGQTRRYRVVVTSITASAEAAVVYGLWTAGN